MAGDWINIRSGVLTEASFWNVATGSGLTEGELFVALFKAAEWMQTHSKHGFMECSVEVLDRVMNVKDLSKVFISEGWILESGNGFLFTTKFPATKSYTRKGFSAQFRKQFLEGKICEICGSDGPLEIDHIVPIKKGGGHDIQNLQPLCMPCNRRKSSK